jgi:hypothetical protein
MGVFSDAVKPPAVKAGYGTRKKAKNTLRRLRSFSKTKAHQVLPREISQIPNARNAERNARI